MLVVQWSKATPSWSSSCQGATGDDVELISQNLIQFSFCVFWVLLNSYSNSYTFSQELTVARSGKLLQISRFCFSFIFIWFRLLLRIFQLVSVSFWYSSHHSSVISSFDLILISMFFNELNFIIFLLEFWSALRNCDARVLYPLVWFLSIIFVFNFRGTALCLWRFMRRKLIRLRKVELNLEHKGVGSRRCVVLIYIFWNISNEFALES